MTPDISSLKARLAELKRMRDAGELSPEAYQQARTGIEKQLVALVLNAPDTAPAAPSAPPVPRAPKRLLAGLAAAVVVFAVAGYAWQGEPRLLGGTPVPVAREDGQDGGHATSNEQILAMTERLAAKLKETPQDAQGWMMLARSYTVLDRYEEAVQAYGKALALRPDDAEVVVDYADALALKNNRTLDGEPMKLIERALKLDPNNLKALALAGTQAFNQRDFKTAVVFWERMVKVGPAEHPFVKQMAPALAEARQLAGLPPASEAPVAFAAAGPSAPSAGGAQPPAPGAAGGATSGTVTLSAALQKDARPTDTVFIYARPAQGSRMPLAVLRKQVSDLPIRFTLDDSMAMTPQGRLSQAGQVIVGARISSSGNAMQQSGDLVGQTGPLAPGASDLKIEISERVK